jgi:outer membrane protein OmpA-like peptidoglycan-associated protein
MIRKLTVLVLFVLGLSTHAAASPESLGVRLVAVVSGDDQPGIELNPSEAVRNLTVKLTRSDGQASTLTGGAIAAGTKKVLSVKQPVGKFEYKAHFDVSWGSGSSESFDMQFDLTRVEKLKLELAPQDVNLDTRTMTFKLNNPGKSASLEIFGKSNDKIATVTKDLAGVAGGTPITINWNDPGQEIVYMDLKVTDIAGFWKGVRLTPFSVSIPHEEVEFETGKWEIRPSEEPKLKKTLGLIKDALDKHGKLIELRTYVAGYTDTVGSKESNKTLSNNRARAIAAWFQKNGLKVPIFYQGFGEEVLAKPTPDETPEQANRRALYVLSSQTPAISTQLPKQNWTRL